MSKVCARVKTFPLGAVCHRTFESGLSGDIWDEWLAVAACGQYDPLRPSCGFLTVIYPPDHPVSAILTSLYGSHFYTTVDVFSKFVMRDVSIEVSNDLFSTRVSTYVTFKRQVWELVQLLWRLKAHIGVLVVSPYASHSLLAL